MSQRVECIRHCESGEGLWLQEEAALHMHSFRDAEPQPEIPQDPNNNHGMSLKQPTPGLHISLTTTEKLAESSRKVAER